MAALTSSEPVGVLRSWVPGAGVGGDVESVIVIAGYPIVPGGGASIDRMLHGIDHIVVACDDPDATAAQITDEIGLAFTGGGRHPGAGTWNRLAFLADEAYLELIGVADRREALGSPVGASALRALDERGGGFASYAVRSDELEDDVTMLQATGAALTDPLHGSRDGADGETVEWWISVPERLGPDGLPFLIRHALVGREWGPDAVRQRVAFRHPIGSPMHLVRLDIATDDPPSRAGDYAEQLGISFRAVADLAVAQVGPHIIRLLPSREMATVATIVLAAGVDTPRSADIAGVRWDVDPVPVLAR